MSISDQLTHIITTANERRQARHIVKRRRENVAGKKWLPATTDNRDVMRTQSQPVLPCGNAVSRRQMSWTNGHRRGPSSLCSPRISPPRGRPQLIGPNWQPSKRPAPTHPPNLGTFLAHDCIFCTLLCEKVRPVCIQLIPMLQPSWHSHASPGLSGRDSQPHSRNSLRQATTGPGPSVTWTPGRLDI